MKLIKSNASKQKHEDAQDNASNSESVCFTRVQSGDQQAFNDLYQKYCGRVYALVLRISGNAESAHEITQEVFIQIWRKADQYAGQSALYTWIHSIATNTAISYLRKQNRNGFGETQGKEIADTFENTSLQDSHLMDLDRYILRLPHRSRAVFVLHAIEGLRHEDIANMMDITTTTSKTHFHRAKQLLTSWLEENS